MGGGIIEIISNFGCCKVSSFLGNRPRKLFCIIFESVCSQKLHLYSNPIFKRVDLIEVVGVGNTVNRS